MSARSAAVRSSTSTSRSPRYFLSSSSTRLRSVMSRKTSKRATRAAAAVVQIRAPEVEVALAACGDQCHLLLRFRVPCALPEQDRMLTEDLGGRLPEGIRDIDCEQLAGRWIQLGDALRAVHDDHGVGECLDDRAARHRNHVQELEPGVSDRHEHSGEPEGRWSGVAAGEEPDAEVVEDIDGPRQCQRDQVGRRLFVGRCGGAEDGPGQQDHADGEQ